MTTFFFATILVVLFIFVPYLNLLVLKKALGISIFLEIFYLIGHYLFHWPFPTPSVILQILVVVGLGVALGVVFARIWPMSPKPGFERIIRTFLLVIPALGIGVGLQLLLQGNEANQAVYLIFAVAAWLGSGHFIRRVEDEKNNKEVKSKRQGLFKIR